MNKSLLETETDEIYKIAESRKQLLDAISRLETKRDNDFRQRWNEIFSKLSK